MHYWLEYFKVLPAQHIRPKDGAHRIQRPSFGSDHQSMDERVRVAVELMRSSPSCDFKRLAGTLGLSPSRLRHLFRAQIGVSPGRFLKLVRLDRARTLLASSTLLVKEVAARVGASDVSHFVRSYKSFYGETPSRDRIEPVPDPNSPVSSNQARHQLYLPLAAPSEPAAKTAK